MPLLQLISRRLLQLIGVLAGISLVTFLLVHMAPGDPARLLAGERASAESIAAIRAQYGLDLPLWALRLASIAIPFATGLIYFGIRPRLITFDIAVVITFAIISVATMNAWLGWHDNIPLLPQGPAAWRETFFYALSIGASLFSGMLLRVTQAALSARGLVSLPELRRGLQAVHGKIPMETLKTIETTILMATTAISAIAGLVAGILGVK